MPAPSPIKTRARPSGIPVGMGPGQIFQLFTGLPIPDPITFVLSEDYLDRGAIMYPRQATLLKIIFLRDDLFTEYDHRVIDEWETSFRETGNNGIVPGVRKRIAFLKGKGHNWFRETLLVMGRRAGKGHISGLSLAYVLWNYMAKGDPQHFYGVDRDKKLVSMVFAGKRDQAKATVWQDAVNYITGSTCFLPYIRTPLQAEKLSIYAPHDFVRMRRLAQQGVNPHDINLATFELVPKESTLMAGRGPTSFSQAWDEMAHVVASGANRSAEEVYAAAKPSLDQFGKDAFIIEPSSPWQMLGQFYVNYCNALLMDDETGEPVYPEMLMVQLTSWDIYVDWEIAHEIPVFPDGYMGDLGEYEGKPRLYFNRLRGAIQAYDDLLAREEQANPDTFKVERRSHFAVALDAYLNEAKVKSIFQPWTERNAHFGGPMLGMQQRGRLDLDYKAHGDPSKCLTADSYVFSDQGVMKITQVEEGDTLVNSVGTDRVAEWIESGEKEIYRLRLQYGHEVRGSIEHPVLTQRGWVRLGDLVPRKDRVKIAVGAEMWSPTYMEVPRVRVSKRSSGTPCHPVAKVDERMGRLLGYIVSEGSIQSYMLTVTAHVDEPTCDDAIELVRDLFGLEPTWERAQGKARTVGWNNTHLMSTLAALGLCFNGGASQKEVPWAILQSPRSVVVEFLRAYFSGDGMATAPTAKDRLASVTTASPQLAQQVQILLLNLGIVSQRESWWAKINEVGDRRQYWRVNIRGEYLRRFAAEVGFLEGFEPKSSRLVELVLFPVKPVDEDLHLPVVEVVADGVEQTYDLRMESGEHNFAANGLICHNSNANFGLAMAHAEPGPDGRLHVVFDRLHHFEPGNFEGHIVDYDEIEEWIWDNFLGPFMPTEMTFDQFNSAQVIQRLAKRSRKAALPKVTQVYEKTATKQHNWKRAEIFKTAVYMGWVHAPYYEQAELELRFLQEKNGVVDHPDSGPVQTKDVADAMMECVMALIGDQIVSMRAELGSMRPQGALQGGVEPFPGMSSHQDLFGAPQTQEQVFKQLGGFGKARGMRPDMMRGGPRNRGRRL